MPREHIAVGTKFGRWSVLGDGEPRPTRRGDPLRTLRCVCECGTEKTVLLLTLRSGSSKSCGCLGLERLRGPKPERMNDLTGKRFGWLVVSRLHKLGGGKTRWYCTCDCGAEKSVLATHLVRGNTKSCGCQVGAGNAERNRANAKHGMWKTNEFAIWTGMLARCNNPSHHQYHRYGARDIKVCQEWQESFLAFYKHLGDRPSPRHSIDRIDNSKGYEPGNVRWATPIEQCNNKTNNVWLEAEGRRWTVAQYARHTGVSSNCIRSRMKRGITGEALGAPSSGSKRT